MPNARTRRRERPGAHRRVADEAFARIDIDQPVKDTDWTLTDDGTVRFEAYHQ